jgi:hypothetical protein
MGSSILHITNGDLTTNYLKKLKFSGRFITWREMLCEGKTTSDVGSESFWKNRFHFLNSSYKITKKKFIDYTLKEYRNLCNQKAQKEIVLWFNYNLFCQINMLAVLSWIKRYRKGHHISLVCSGKVEASHAMCTISNLNSEQIIQHFENRIELKQDDLEYADYIWQLYCSDSPLRLETVYLQNTTSPFQYLNAALATHLQRFPSIENGLNKIENTILKTANKHSSINKNQLVNTLLKEQEIYGFRKLHFVDKIDKLGRLFSSFNSAELNEKGKEVLKNQLNFYSQIRNDISYLGGSKKYSFLYLKETKKLLQITT